MKALVTIIMLGALGVGGWYLYTRVLRPPEKRVCARLGELCGESRGGERCEKGMLSLRKMAGEEGFDKAVRCVHKAESCMGAVGCVAGAGFGGLGDFIKGVTDGLAPAVEQQGKELLDKLKKKLDD